MSRSREAFLFSVQKLYDETKDLYLWTFTFRDVPDSDDSALRAWADACMRAYRQFKGIHGVRVIELHKSHGIHFHLLLNRRFAVDRMREIFWPHGFGRIHVTKADPMAGRYLAKYLSKAFRRAAFIGKRRLWGSFGGFKACKCKDVVFEGPFQRNKFLLSGIKFNSQGERAAAYWALIAASQCGDFSEWPDEMKAMFCRAVGRLSWTKSLIRNSLTNGPQPIELDYDLAELRQFFEERDLARQKAASAYPKINSPVEGDTMTRRIESGL